MMRVFIGDNEITSFLLEVPYNDTLDKTLDSFTFTYRTTSSPETEGSRLKKYSKIEIRDDNLGLLKYLALQSYTYKYEGRKWIYSVDCISPTKILENIIINGMAETRKNSSLVNQFNRVLAKINKEIEWENRNYYPYIYASQALLDLLDGRTGRDFKWDGQVTIREMFDDFLRPLDAYIIVNNFWTESAYIIDMGGNHHTEDYVYRIELGYVLENGAPVNNLSDTSHEIARGTSITSVLNTIDNGLNQNYKISGFESFNESEYEMDTCQAIVKNAVPDNYYNTGWANLRSESLGIWSSDNVCLITDEPIYDVDRENFTMIIPALASVTYVKSVSENSYSTADNKTLLIGFPVSLGNYLYEKAEYDILPKTVQQKALWFERGKKNIYGFTNMYKDNVIGKFNIVAIEEIINEITTEMQYEQEGVDFLWRDFAISAWYRDYVEDAENFELLHTILTNGTTFLSPIPDDTSSLPDLTGFTLTNGLNYDGKHLVFDGTTNLYSVKDLSILIYHNSDLSKILFNARYLPYVNTAVMSKKMDFDDKLTPPGFTKGLSIIENQNDKNIELSRFCRSQQSLINRLGERIAYLDVKINTSEGGVLWPLGDFIRITPNNSTIGDCWKITQRELTQYNDTTYKCRYTLAKNYNANNASISLDREKRTFDIPLDGFVDRYIYVQVPNGSNLDNYDSSLTYCVDYDTVSCYSLNNISKYKSDNISFYKTTYLDNFSANVYKTKISGTKVNVPMRYCDTEGEQTNLTISLVNFENIMRNSNINNIPRISVTEYTNMSKFSRTLFGIDKDPFERLIIIFYQFR